LQLIKVHEELQGDYIFDEVAGSDGRITFNRYGFAPGGSRTLRICGPDRLATRIRGVVIQNSGRIRLAADENDNNIVEHVQATGAGSVTVEDMSCT